MDYLGNLMTFCTGMLYRRLHEGRATAVNERAT